MSNEMKAKLKPIIIIVIVLVILAAGFFIAKSILSSRNIPIFDFTQNETNGMPEDTITTDDIFGEDITPEEKDFLATNNTITPDNTNSNVQTNKDSSINLSGNGLYEVNTNNIPDIPPSSKPNNNRGSSAYTYNTENTVLVTTSNTLRPNNNAMTVLDDNTNQSVRISSFIINYNDRFVASRNNPLLITLAVKTPPEARYAKIRVYARKIDNNYNILSRDLVFYLPKIYVLDGQAQTQFYFAGRMSSGSRYLTKGRYLLYAEAEITDANGMSVGKTGRYPLPKWNYVVTLE
ncbi:hypothetical protein R4K54_00615 [Brachyspira murdochii]|uniref:Uncharacterized protein n=2 Tax=Brachyspira murdochii TaxID=84378 RepID=D5U512_BRAM5|nr:hypothetical protein [Brachyspira murdochii]ADG72416.1 conserved hypothetical protein [Brachyspira murdochii DSM 12563]PPS21481.1 hypothetical protein DJ52_10570 [Brachyspira murdochii]